MVSRKSDIKVGLFVLVGFFFAALVIFLIGQERRFFSKAVTFHTRFRDVQGLKPGAPVRMGGVRIGQVNEVSYGGVDDVEVHVLMEIVAEDAPRIRDDSKVRVVPKGMLGDRMVSISAGHGAALEAGSELQSEEPNDLMGSIDEMAGKAKSTMDDVSVLAEELSDKELHRDIRQSARSVSVLLKQLTEGQGYPQRLLNDPAEAERISRVIGSLDETSRQLNLTLQEVRGAMHRIRKGPGFAHDVLFGDGPSKELAQFGQAAHEVALTLKAVREGDGFAHDVLFGGDDRTSDAFSNITAMTADLRDIVRDVKKGKGTLGALLVDPSIYEDVKRVLGNVERNNVLRSLVRYSIKKDAKKPKVTVKPASP